MASERDIQDAEAARLEVIVIDLGTESERDELELCAALKRAGVPLASESLSGISVLARLTRRVERRARWKLPRVACAGSPPNPVCRCLERALDEPDVGGKRAVLKLAAGFHWKPAPPRSEQSLPVEESTAPAKGSPATVESEAPTCLAPAVKRAAQDSVVERKRQAASAGGRDTGPPDPRNFSVWKRGQSNSIAGLFDRRF